MTNYSYIGKGMIFIGMTGVILTVWLASFPFYGKLLFTSLISLIVGAILWTVGN